MKSKSKMFLFFKYKKALFHTNILFLSILILYFAIRKCVYFFILEIKFHLYFKSMGKVYNKPIVMKDASLFLPAFLFPLATAQY